MSMIGREFKSEKRKYEDEKTGREVWQLTGGDSNNIHIYFTDNSFSIGDKEIYFLSDRSSEEKGILNFFKMELDSGRITQITDEATGIGGPTKTSDSDILVYTTRNKIVKMNTSSGQRDVIYEEKENIGMGSPFISPDKRYVGVARNERFNTQRVGPNYSGFTDIMYSTKKGWITLVAMNGSKVSDVYEDSHWLGHFQFAPDENTVATFCHEGPWNLVQQRIWIIDFMTRNVVPCFRQGKDDCVGHEFWTRDGLIFFDNRGKGHDGTITSSKTQLADFEMDLDQIPYIGFANKNGEVIKTIDMPFYCNHYHANNDNSLLVGDEVEDLVLIDIKREKAELKTLCSHMTSWYTGQTHCHPTFGWNGEKILFASDRSGKINLYLTDVH